MLDSRQRISKTTLKKISKQSSTYLSSLRRCCFQTIEITDHLEVFNSNLRIKVYLIYLLQVRSAQSLPAAILHMFCVECTKNMTCKKSSFFPQAPPTQPLQEKVNNQEFLNLFPMWLYGGLLPTQLPLRYIDTCFCFSFSIKYLLICQQ